MRYRLIALDIDGTLLNSRSELTPRVVAAVRLAQRAGMGVCLVSGRRPRAIAPVAQALGISFPMLAYNGGVIADPVTLVPLRVTTIPRQVAIIIIGRWHEAGLSALAYRSSVTPPDVYCVLEPTWPQTLGYLAREGENVARVNSPADDISFDPLRLMVADSWERTELARVVAQPLLDPAQFRVFHTQHYDSTWYYEVYPPVSKADGLSYILERYGYEQREVVAVGDHLNDIDMLELAGLGVAMGNARAEVKSRADLVIGHHDEDGLAVLIERLVRGKLPR